MKGDKGYKRTPEVQSEVRCFRLRLRLGMQDYGGLGLL
jgi:hypothetical protein